MKEYVDLTGAAEHLVEFYDYRLPSHTLADDSNACIADAGIDIVPARNSATVDALVIASTVKNKSLPAKTSGRKSAG